MRSSHQPLWKTTTPMAQLVQAPVPPFRRDRASSTTKISGARREQPGHPKLVLDRGSSCARRRRRWQRRLGHGAAATAAATAAARRSGVKQRGMRSRRPGGARRRMRTTCTTRRSSRTPSAGATRRRRRRRAIATRRRIWRAINLGSPARREELFGERRPGKLSEA